MGTIEMSEEPVLSSSSMKISWHLFVGIRNGHRNIGEFAGDQFEYLIDYYDRY